ncbi:DUF2637 domain-containing protein [Streptomyces sp. NPDC058464]|uniref:DUF2637 domain-containing protein n=1 Tax=Streptomyces sp. NPDC058464 TaxID=3346511 RepID=UPI003660CB2C
MTGAMIIAGIGFAGSYAAVRQLAIKKGFGNFSYVFPIGIDAGICVLLALDLLLTWIRIPFPLLRQTAWLLTVATIAFNGAAAWPDPLGVGMHAVIPILFVVSVEAARHAIGRIADITADKHMEGVRLTRWLLSPVPTFLLWRRMKLWELRSYDQVIKLEQERLVYQARLRSRFGRAWRRKAPVKSLMPLCLAKYGVPLADMAPDGLAAGIKLAEPLPDSTSAPSPDSTAGSRATGTTRAGNGGTSQAAQALEKTPADKQLPESAASPHPELAAYEPEPEPTSWYELEQQRYQHDPLAQEQRQLLLKQPSWKTTTSVHSARPPHTQDQHTHRHATGQAPHTPQHDTTSNSQPTTTRQDHPTPESARHKESTGTTTTAYGKLHDRLAKDNAPNAGADQESATASAHALHEERGTRIDAAIDETPRPSKDPADVKDPTLVDRYYQVWIEHHTQHGREPTPGELSALLAGHGMLGRDNKPIAPSTLRRYLLPFRLYTVWAEHRTHTTTPSPDTVAQDCTHRGITAQHNKPITPTHINKHTNDFQRRWHTHTHHNPVP